MSNVPEVNHLKYPCNKRDSSGECGGERHEDCSDPRVGAAAEAKQHREARETGSDGDEDECVGEVVHNTTIDLRVTEEETRLSTQATHDEEFEWRLTYNRGRWSECGTQCVSRFQSNRRCRT